MDMKNYLWTQITLYEEDKNLPYMKKTRKKKQVCGAACFMAAEIKFSEDVRLSVTPFWLCFHHPIIMKFSGVITNDQSDVHAKGQGQRSKVKVTEVTTQLIIDLTAAKLQVKTDEKPQASKKKI